MVRSLLLASAATLAVPSFAATPQPMANSAAISGLGIRNIGSAQMSGRVAAVAARQEAHRFLDPLGRVDEPLA